MTLELLKYLLPLRKLSCVVTFSTSVFINTSGILVICHCLFNILSVFSEIRTKTNAIDALLTVKSDQRCSSCLGNVKANDLILIEKSNQMRVILRKASCHSGAYLEPCQTSKKTRFTKIVTG